MYKIDMTSDLGEGFGRYSLDCDEKIIECISSATLACGFHAGDPVVMERSVQLCKKYGVAVGAHPGYPDLMGFGRRKMVLADDELKAYVKYQIGALMAFTRAAGVKLQHLNPHGALGNLHMADEKTSGIICDAMLEVDPDIILLTPVGCAGIRAAKARGMRYASEMFADRAYNEDFSLVPRKSPGAVIEDPDEIVSRVIRMIKEGVLTAATGKELEVEVHSVCVHGDSPTSVQAAHGLRAALEAEGISVVRIDQIV